MGRSRRRTRRPGLEEAGRQADAAPHESDSEQAWTRMLQCRSLINRSLHATLHVSSTCRTAPFIEYRIDRLTLESRYRAGIVIIPRHDHGSVRSSYKYLSAISSQPSTDQRKSLPVRSAIPELGGGTSPSRRTSAPSGPSAPGAAGAPVRGGAPPPGAGPMMWTLGAHLSGALLPAGQPTCGPAEPRWALNAPTHKRRRRGAVGPVRAPESRAPPRARATLLIQPRNSE